jgi:hypothetical protein
MLTLLMKRFESYEGNVGKKNYILIYFRLFINSQFLLSGSLVLIIIIFHPELTFGKKKKFPAVLALFTNFKLAI